MPADDRRFEASDGLAALYVPHGIVEPALV
jgi:hypothetical protein